MAATTRWVEFDSNATTSLTAATTSATSGTGTVGYVEGSSAVSGVVTITASVADQMQVSVNGGSLQQITLTSGVNLDARMVAREISFKLKQLPGAEWDHINCEYINNKFRIYSGLLGNTSSCSVSNGSNDCLQLLGMASSAGGPLTTTNVNGIASTNNAGFTGNLTASGTYVGAFDDIYTVFIGSTHPIGNPIPSGTNTYAGTASSNGFLNTASGLSATTETYTLTINTTNGSTLNSGFLTSPSFTVTSTQGDTVATPTVMLYSNFYYEVGTKGLRIKFTDAPFGNNDKFTVTCSAIQFAQGASTAAAVGTAQYHWSSLHGAKSTSPTTTQTTGTAVALGLTVAFSNSGSLTRRDAFRILVSAVQPTTLGTTLLAFGPTTVSTASSCKSVWFEIVSGAVTLSDCKFGLFSHGTLSHHDQGNADTEFRFGSVGRGVPSANGSEWHTGVSPVADLDSDIPPAYLSATEDNLHEINTATLGKTIGVCPGQMVTDFIFLSIFLGNAETGSATVTWRQYYNYS